jgi:DNA-binding NarL/FixJ family response regulator
VSQDIIRVVVADDQAIVREGMATVLDLLDDIAVVGAAADGDEAYHVALETQADVVLMDLRMPVLDGAGATERILAERPETAILVLTTYADDASVMGALRAGARGYLTKDASRAEVATAIRAVAGGQTTLAGDVGARLIGSLVEPDRVTSGADGAADIEEAEDDSDAADDSAGHASSGMSPAALRARFTQLTAREAEVLSLVARGYSNTEIAATLFIGVSTVKSHINTLFAKLGVQDRAKAIARVWG